MPRPTYTPPVGAGLTQAKFGCMDLLAATKQWQLETGRDERCAAELIFLDYILDEFLVSKGLPTSCLPVPFIIVGRPYALPYRRGRGADNPDAGEEHRYGSLIVNMVLPIHDSLGVYEREAEIVSRMEVIIEQARSLRNTPRSAEPRFTHWNFTGYSIMHANDGQSGEPAPVEDREEGKAWDFRNWDGTPLLTTPWASTWVLDFGY